MSKLSCNYIALVQCQKKVFYSISLSGFIHLQQTVSVELHPDWKCDEEKCVECDEKNTDHDLLIQDIIIRQRSTS